MARAPSIPHCKAAHSTKPSNKHQAASTKPQKQSNQNSWRTWHQTTPPKTTSAISKMRRQTKVQSKAQHQPGSRRKTKRKKLEPSLMILNSAIGLPSRSIWPMLSWMWCRILNWGRWVWCANRFRLIISGFWVRVLRNYSSIVRIMMDSMLKLGQ